MNEIRLLSSPPVPSLRAETDNHQDRFPFRLGEIHRARILQQAEPNRFFLQVGDRRLWVESRVPLPISREFTVRVEETEPKVILKLLSPQAPGELQLSSLLKKYLGSDVSLEFLADRLSLLAKGGFQEIPPSVKGSLENFRSSLRSLPDLSALQPETLRALAEKSGIFWENKIKNWMEGTRGEPLSRILQEDLKGLGMKLLAELQGAGGQEGDPLRVEILKRDLEAFLLKVELYQVLNLRNPEPTDRLYLIFPFWLGSHLQMAELNLSFPKKERRPEGEEEFSLLFLLNLPSWGKLRIEVQIRERALFCRFWVGDAQAAESIRLGLSALKTRLEKLGFEPHLQASVDGEEIPTGAVAQELGKEAPSLLSVMI